MICSHIHDFIRGTKIALTSPQGEKLGGDLRWDIVRPNEAADQMMFRHLETLNSLEVQKTRKIAKS